MSSYQCRNCRYKDIIFIRGIDTWKGFYIETGPDCSKSYTLQDLTSSWWRHQMEILSAWLALCEGGGGGGCTGHRWIPLTKASDTELWCFLWSTPEQTVEQTIEMPAIWDAIIPSLWWYCNDAHGLRFVCVLVWSGALWDTYVIQN